MAPQIGQRTSPGMVMGPQGQPITTQQFQGMRPNTQPMQRMPMQGPMPQFTGNLQPWGNGSPMPMNDPRMGGLTGGGMSQQMAMQQNMPGNAMGQPQGMPQAPMGPFNPGSAMGQPMPQAMKPGAGSAYKPMPKPTTPPGLMGKPPMPNLTKTLRGGY